MPHLVASFAPSARRSVRYALAAVVAASVGFAAPSAVAQNSLPNASPAPEGSAADGERVWSLESAPIGFVGAFIAARQAERRGDLKVAAWYFRRALRARQNDLTLMRAAMRFSLLVGDVGEATTIAHWMASGRAGSANAPLVLIIDAIAAKRYDEARQILSDNGGEIPAVLRDLVRGWAAYGSGDAEAAFAAFLADPEAPGKGLFGNLHAGYLASALGEHEKAIAYYDAAKAAQGGWIRELAIASAMAHRANGRADLAAGVLAEALEQTPYDDTLIAAEKRLQAEQPIVESISTPTEGVAAALVSVGRALGTQQQTSKELSLIYAQLARFVEPGYTPGHVLAGDRLSDVEQHELAVAAFMEAPRTSLFAIEARYGLSVATAQTGDVKRAIEEMSALIETGARSPDLYTALGVFSARERAYTQCAEAHEQAIARLQEIFGQFSQRHWAAFFDAGICRERAGDWAAAEKHFKEALALQPDQADVLNYYGYSLLEQRTRYDEARDMIERAVAAQPTSGHIVDSLGWVLWRTGDFEGAVRELARAISLEPTVYEINDHYGDALWMVGRRREARFHWKRALVFDPKDDEIRARIERKIEVGLDVVLSEEGDRPPRAVEESSAPSGALPNGG